MEQVGEVPALPGRWTVCAMLFVATTINYMDRQVLSILKPVLSGTVLHLQPFFHGWPTVERSIDMNEIQYGNIVLVFPDRVCAWSNFCRAAGGSAGLQARLSDRDCRVEFVGDGARFRDVGFWVRSGTIFPGPGRERKFSGCD